MNFLPLYEDDSSRKKEHFTNLGLNVLKIKFYYEEDALSKLHYQTDDQQEFSHLLEKYQHCADEATLMLKAIAFFKKCNYIEEEDLQYYLIVLEYFFQVEKKLKNFEIKDHSRFLQWLKNKEYSFEYGSEFLKS